MKPNYYEIKAISNVVRDIELNSVLLRTGAIEDKSDKAKWHTSEGAISITGSKFMNWNKGIGGGGAIDLVMHLEKLNFVNAVVWLSKQFLSSSTTIAIPDEIKSDALKQPFKLPTRDDCKLFRVFFYLTQKRHIPSHLIKSLIKSCKLYADIKANAVFLLLGKEKRVVGAELRGSTDIPWRGMAAGSNKSMGYFCMKNHSTNKIILCESAIDAISCLVIYPDHMTISTSGANPNPAWLNTFINQKYEVHCGFDSDQTGDAMAEKMINIYPTVKRLRPDNHDWNETLISKSIG